MYKVKLFILLFFFWSNAFPYSIYGGNNGVLFSPVSTIERDSISNKTGGVTIYNEDSGVYEVWTGTKWQPTNHVEGTNGLIGEVRAFAGNGVPDGFLFLYRGFCLALHHHQSP